MLQEINGYTVADRKPVEGFTSSEGRRLYRVRLLDLFRLLSKTASIMTARRKPQWEQNWVAPEWAWAWPHNRRILYNRASADPEGRPWSERKKLVWWDEAEEEVGGSRHAGLHRGAPAVIPARRRMHAERTRYPAIDPFVMQADGKGWIYVPAGLAGRPAAHAL